MKRFILGALVLVFAFSSFSVSGTAETKTDVVQDGEYYLTELTAQEKKEALDAYLQSEVEVTFYTDGEELSDELKTQVYEAGLEFSGMVKKFYSENPEEFYRLLDGEEPRLYYPEPEDGVDISDFAFQGLNSETIKSIVNSALGKSGGFTETANSNCIKGAYKGYADFHLYLRLLVGNVYMCETFRVNIYSCLAPGYTDVVQEQTDYKIITHQHT